jgi:3D (Asp-Asp-Asp) domain-containing protein
MNTPTVGRSLVFCLLTLLVSYVLSVFILEAQEDKAAPEAILKSELFTGCRIETMSCDVTAYCPEACCNSGFQTVNGERVPVDWSDKVAAGALSIKKLHETGINIVAVDPSEIPLGSIMRYAGRYYIALDRGSAIKGNRIDISLAEHGESEEFGIKLNQLVTVFIPRRPREVVNEIRKRFQPE